MTAEKNQTVRIRVANANGETVVVECKWDGTEKSLIEARRASYKKASAAGLHWPTHIACYV